MPSLANVARKRSRDSGSSRPNEATANSERAVSAVVRQQAVRQLDQLRIGLFSFRALRCGHLDSLEVDSLLPYDRLHKTIYTLSSSRRRNAFLLPTNSQKKRHEPSSPAGFLRFSINAAAVGCAQQAQTILAVFPRCLAASTSAHPPPELLKKAKFVCVAGLLSSTSYPCGAPCFFGRSGFMKSHAGALAT